MMARAQGKFRLLRIGALVLDSGLAGKACAPGMTAFLYFTASRQQNRPVRTINRHNLACVSGVTG